MPVGSGGPLGAGRQEVRALAARRTRTRGLRGLRGAGQRRVVAARIAEVVGGAVACYWRCVGVLGWPRSGRVVRGVRLHGAAREVVQLMNRAQQECGS